MSWPVYLFHLSNAHAPRSCLATSGHATSPSPLCLRACTLARDQRRTLNQPRIDIVKCSRSLIVGGTRSPTFGFSLTQQVLQES